MLLLPQPHSVQDLAVAMPDAAAFSLSRIVVILTLFFILNTACNTTERSYRSRKIYYVQGQVTWLLCTHSLPTGVISAGSGPPGTAPLPLRMERG